MITLNVVPKIALRMVIRARSATRRMPWIKAPWAEDISPNNTARPRNMMAPTCCSSPKVTRDMKPAKSTRNTAPRPPNRRATRLSVITVRAIRFESPVPTELAIWRTPLVLMPMPAMLRASSEIDQYNPNRPTPAGPSSKAMALLRPMPMMKPRPMEPPIIIDDFSTWPWLRRSGAAGSAGRASATTADDEGDSLMSGFTRAGKN